MEPVAMLVSDSSLCITRRTIAGISPELSEKEVDKPSAVPAPPTDRQRMSISAVPRHSTIRVTCEVQRNECGHM